MPNNRAKTPAHLKKQKEIQKAYIGNNLVRSMTTKTRRNKSARGTRKSQKSISKDDQIDQTLVKIESAIGVLTSKLSEFVTRTELNKRLAELEQTNRNRFAENEAHSLQNQLNAIKQPRKSLQRQSSEVSGVSFDSADLFERRSPAIKNKSTSKK